MARNLAFPVLPLAPRRPFRWTTGRSVARLPAVNPLRPCFAMLAALAFARPLLADDALPKAQPAGRYEPMAARSPFMAPTVPLPVATPPPAPAGPHWWDQMSITSLMEAGGT